MSNEEEQEEQEDNVVAVDFSRGRARPEPPAKDDHSHKSGTSGVYDAVKRFAFDKYIAEGLVQIEFATMYPGVVIPEHLKAKPIERLNFSHKFRVADFKWDETGVSATLSVNKTPAFCHVPWGAIFVMLSKAFDEAIAWPCSYPVSA